VESSRAGALAQMLHLIEAQLEREGRDGACFFYLVFRLSTPLPCSTPLFPAPPPPRPPLPPAPQVAARPTSWTLPPWRR
jgi:hypothetical protein